MKNSRPKKTPLEVLNDFRKVRLLKFCEEPKSIVEIEREFNMNRGSVKQQIKFLEDRGFVKKTYLNNVKGKPAQIITIKEKINKTIEKFEEEQKTIREKHFQENANNPLTNKILNAVKDNPNLTPEEILGKDQIKNNVQRYSLIGWLLDVGFLKTITKLTPEGEKFLKKNTIERGSKK